MTNATTMTSNGIPSVNAIIDGFPQQPAKIQGLPNYHTLNALRQQLYWTPTRFQAPWEEVIMGIWGH
jgi:hypothetical protein